MFPEDDLRAEFWLFVRQRALDLRASRRSGEPEGTPALDWLEETRATITYFLDESSQYVAYEQGGPATYDTLQEALVAFLIYEVSKKGKGLVTSGFPFGYATWLRTVVLIVADVQRDRMLLTVTVPTDYTGKASLAATHRRDHTMTLGDNWDCLSRDTFNAIRQAFSRSG